MGFQSAYAILIVEDERIVAKDLQHTLNAMGYDAFAIASTADDALRCAEQRLPDLVLMDIRIKGSRDGIETADLLRKRHGVPVVYLTAHADDATIERAKRTDPHGYLMKPVKTAELRSAIEISIHRHEMEKQLRERERWLSTTLRSIHDAVVMVNLAGRVTFINPAAEHLLEAAAAEVIGRPAREVVRLVAAMPACPLDDALAHRRSVATLDARLDVPSGAGRMISGSAAPVIDDGELLGAAMVFRDITDQKQVQQKLEIADRLASLGTLTSGVAHQINNPLAVVLANTSYLRGELDDICRALAAGDNPGEVADRIRELSDIHAEISAAGWRIGKIVADLKAFSRPTEPASGAADIARAINWAIRTTEHEFRHRAKVSREVAALPPAIADETRLGQVFVNLLMNAAQAMALGTANDNEVAIRGRTDGERIIVEVQDSGPGIAPEDLRRIFEPFFTTRAIGQGTGLGLSVCHGIIKSVGGELQVESELGTGTTFRVILRSAAAPQPAVAPAAAATAAAMNARRGRILLVDDDPMVYRALKRILRDHDLVWTENAREALEKIELGQRFDLILSELMMPVMTGIELYDQLLDRAPDQARRTVFVTGAARSTPQGEEFLRGVANATLEKPFGMPEVQALVARMLAADGEGAPTAPRAASGET